MRKLRIAVLLFLVSCFSTYANSLAVNLENDTFSFPKKDHEYSHGTELVYMADSAFWLFDNWGIGAEQTMYTPPLLKTDDLQLGEHPYCGYLSLNFIGENYIDVSEKLSLTLQHQLGFGTVGPHSHSEQSQKVIHRWLGCKEPKGWKWQISNEAVVQYQLYGNLNWEIFNANHFNGFLIPRFGIDVGGFKDMLAIGADFKFGWNALRNVGSNMILSVPRRTSAFSCFSLVGVEGRCIFHDTSIDGGFFRESVHVEQSEMWVGEFHWGVGISYKNVEIDYFNFIRSNELENSHASKPNYGRISLKIAF